MAMAPLVALALLLPAATARAGGTVYSGDPDTGLGTWRVEAGGMAVRLTQITPDQARAFYLARGFPAADAEHFAAACVFMSVARNTGAEPLSYRLQDWRYGPAGGALHPVLTKEDWLAEWQARGVPESARLAFAWAQLPTEQTYEPGDWNQGMTSYRLPRGSRFDLRFVWRSGGRVHEGVLRDARCAE
jgi:hypothetical protein